MHRPGRRIRRSPDRDSVGLLEDGVALVPFPDGPGTAEGGLRGSRAASLPVNDWVQARESPQSAQEDDDDDIPF